MEDSEVWTFQQNLIAILLTTMRMVSIGEPAYSLLKECARRERAQKDSGSNSPFKQKSMNLDSAGSGSSSEVYE